MPSLAILLPLALMQINPSNAAPLGTPDELINRPPRPIDPRRYERLLVALGLLHHPAMMAQEIKQQDPNHQTAQQKVDQLLLESPFLSQSGPFAFVQDLLLGNGRPQDFPFRFDQRLL